MSTFNFHFSKKSGNKKTGAIPVTTTSRNSCPSSCPFMNNGCYADSGPLRLHWQKVSDGSRSITDKELFAHIKALPKGQLWRHNQAGDLPHNNDGCIDPDFVVDLVKANKNKNGFTYTHHDVNMNKKTLKYANDNGFTINVSGNNVGHAVGLFKQYKLPTVTVLPIDAPNMQVVDNVKIVACPAEKSDKVNCANCQLCAIADRQYIIGFRAHGTSKKKANLIAAQNI